VLWAHAVNATASVNARDGVIQPSVALPQWPKWRAGGQVIFWPCSSSSISSFAVPSSSTTLALPPCKVFNSCDTALTGPFDGRTLSQDLATICNWTHICDPTNATDHTKDTGHALIAAVFETRLRLVHRYVFGLRTRLRLRLSYHASSAIASTRITAARFSMRLFTVSVSDWGSVSTR
jgi:hypothetical protein